MTLPGYIEDETTAWREKNKREREESGGSSGSSTGITFELDEEEEEENPYRPGTADFYAEEYSTQGMLWQDMVAGRLPGDIANWAKQIGEDPDFVLTWLGGVFGQLIYDVEQQIGRYLTPKSGLGDRDGGQYSQEFFRTPEGLEFIYNMALDWVGARDSRFAGAKPSSGGRRGGGGGRRGSGGPSADDIRKQFDLDQLADRANDLWFSQVLDEAPDARGMARAYVEAVVRNPEQKLDYDTFIQKQVEATSRYKSMYKRKPAGMDAAQFIAPLYQMAAAAAGADEAAGLASDAAKFGGDPNAFRERLGRTDSVRNSAPFMQSLEQRMGALNGVLKG